ncbi:nicotinamide riboside transporter PnuC [Marinilabiliaceae bacterium ANBcel2]|nr:nicotinamide riboside transporter PnuC [Marinilabiliaceae bacterium ANBcel2]
MVDWIAQNWIEITGAVTALLYMYFSIREKFWLWPVGFVTSAFYLVVFYQSQLYADMSLQIYYLLISIYGWFHWAGNSKSVKSGETNLPTISLSYRVLINYLLLTLILTVVIYFVLKQLPQYLNLLPSSLPFGDAFTTAGSIVATWMLARKILENWLLWIFVDLFAMAMYISKELYITAALFMIYTLMAITGYIKWKQNMCCSK